MARHIWIFLGLSAVGLVFIFWITGRAAESAGVTLGLHGWIAIFLGSVASLAVSGGLFALTFYSARSGHDDEVDPRP